MPIMKKKINNNYINIILFRLKINLTLEVTTGPNSARAISADCAHGRNSAQFGMTL